MLCLILAACVMRTIVLELSLAHRQGRPLCPRPKPTAVVLCEPRPLQLLREHGKGPLSPWVSVDRLSSFRTATTTYTIPSTTTVMTTVKIIAPLTIAVTFSTATVISYSIMLFSTVTATSIVPPPPSTTKKTPSPPPMSYFYAKRQVTVTPSSVPTYASACSGTTRYSGACSCYGITGTTTTPPTPVRQPCFQGHFSISR